MNTMHPVIYVYIYHMVIVTVIRRNNNYLTMAITFRKFLPNSLFSSANKTIAKFSAEGGACTRNIRANDLTTLVHSMQYIITHVKLSKQSSHTMTNVYCTQAVISSYR